LGCPASEIYIVLRIAGINASTPWCGPLPSGRNIFHPRAYSLSTRSMFPPPHRSTDNPIVSLMQDTLAEEQASTILGPMTHLPPLRRPSSWSPLGWATARRATDRCASSYSFSDGWPTLMIVNLDLNLGRRLPAISRSLNTEKSTTRSAPACCIVNFFGLLATRFESSLSRTARPPSSQAGLPERG
jgi:hypothetical protein